MENFLIYLLQIIGYSLGTMIIFGIIVYILNRIHAYLICDSIGFGYLKLGSFIGTPIHELGHAIMCVIFAHKITDIKFYDNHSEDGTIGYVKHTYNSKSLYQQIGNLFIGVGPIFSGVLVIGLVLYLCFGDVIVNYVTTSMGEIGSGIDYLQIIINSFKFIPTLALCDVNIFVKLLAALIILSVSLHIHLSLADIKNSLSGFVFFVLLSVIFAIVTTLIGSNVTSAVVSGLEYFSLCTTIIFSLVLVFSAINTCVAIIIYVLDKFFHN